MVLPPQHQLFASPQSVLGIHARLRRQVVHSVHGGHRNSAANADLVGSSAHLIGERSARFQKAGRSAADHGSIGGDAAAIHILRFEAALKGNQIALPHRAAQLAFAANRRQLAVQELLRGMYMAIDKARHRNHARRADRLRRRKLLSGIARRPDPDDRISINRNRSIAHQRVPVIEADNVCSRNQKTHRLFFFAHLISILSPTPGAPSFAAQFCEVAKDLMAKGGVSPEGRPPLPVSALLPIFVPA